MLQRKPLVLALAAFVCLLTISASADSQARIVRLSYVEGDVQLDRLDGRGFSHAFLNMPIVEGTKVWTKADARAEIEFEDGSTVRMAPDTVIDFQQLRLQGRGERSSMLQLQEGTAYFNIDKNREDDFRVLFANEQVTFEEKKVRFRVSVTPNDYHLSVFKGDIEILKSTGGRLMVRKNESVTVEFQDRDRYFLAKGTTTEPHDYWDREREDVRAEYANRPRYDGYSTAYSYGYNDLYRYGTFIQVDWGWGWRPHGVSINWSPYDSGYWVYYPTSGYVFVSNYAWGWHPYRYGSWVYVNRYGWCWRPGREHHSWVTVVNFHNPPRHFVPPATPGVVRASVTPPRSYVPVGRAIDPDFARDDGDGRFRGREREHHGGYPVNGVLGGTPATGGNISADIVPARSGRPHDRGVITNDTLPVDPTRRVEDAEVRTTRGSRGGNVSGQVEAHPVKQRPIDDSSRFDEVQREEQPRAPVNVTPVQVQPVQPNIPTQNQGGVINGRVDRPMRNDDDQPAFSRGGDPRGERSSRTPVVQQQPIQPSPIQQSRPVEQRVDRPQRTWTPPPQPTPQPQVQRPSSPPPSAPAQQQPRSERVGRSQRDQ